MSCAQRQTADNEGVSCESFGGRKQCGGCIPNSSWTFDRKQLAGGQCSLSVDYSRLRSGYLEVALLELDAPCIRMPGERRAREGPEGSATRVMTPSRTCEERAAEDEQEVGEDGAQEL